MRRGNHHNCLAAARFRMLPHIGANRSKIGELRLRPRLGVVSFIQLDIPKRFGHAGLGEAFVGTQWRWNRSSLSKTEAGNKQRGRCVLTFAMAVASDLHYFVRKVTRGDGIAFWLWEVLDRNGWTLVSGTVYGNKALAVEKAQRTIIACRDGSNFVGRKAS